MHKVYFQTGICECELHNKNAFFELKSNFISIQNFKAGNVKPPGMHWSKDFWKVRGDRARKQLI